MEDRGTRGSGALRDGQVPLQRQRVERMVDRGMRGKGARGIAASCGVGNPALRGPASWLGACNWPRVAMAAGAATQKFVAFTEFLQRSAQGCNFLLRICTLSTGCNLFSLRGMVSKD